MRYQVPFASAPADVTDTWPHELKQPDSPPPPVESDIGNLFRLGKTLHEIPDNRKKMLLMNALMQASNAMQQYPKDLARDPVGTTMKTGGATLERAWDFVDPVTNAVGAASALGDVLTRPSWNALGNLAFRGGMAVLDAQAVAHMAGSKNISKVAELAKLNRY